MAEGFLASFNHSFEVVSAGTNAAATIHPKAIQVMQEVGIDLRGKSPKGVDQFISQSFDYVITVCDNAKETCPVFLGSVRHRFHMGFEDPADARGTEEEILGEFRRIRDKIKTEFFRFYSEDLSKAAL
jgi:arsenate reductase (thioredoxin)